MERYSTEIQCTEFTFLTPKGESNGGNYDSQSNQNTQNTSNYQGNNANSNSGSSGNNNNFASQPFNGNDEEEDDLPF
ncbi:nucleic acid-binding protein [Zunongwangia profunda SM-A87]|uniref:Nucleic acid-binding protein n=2 Tax=Zunongwangia profunda TaxID=398743 RepID=D5BCG5_ZUNPS|nr:nucleic acid-binding protein [Zunongwangia profunda SM-A87]